MSNAKNVTIPYSTSKIGENLFLNPAKADVHFVIEPTGERFPAHKILLSSASDVFEVMLYGSLKEEADIKIVDASAAAFTEFLRFFYFSKVTLSMEHVAEVMHLAHKYNVEDCSKFCSNLLTSNVTSENVIPVLSLAILYEKEELRNLCEFKICGNSLEILKSTAFLECNHQTLDHIIGMDFLLCGESDIFEACMRWVKAASKEENLNRKIIQTHLGDSFYKFCFGSMTMDQFIELVPMYGDLFSGEEYKEILQSISTIEFQPKIFKECQRLSWNEDKLIECYLVQHSISRYNLRTVEATTFSTNTTLLWKSFRCAVMYDDQCEEANIKNIRATILANSNEIQPAFSFDNDSSDNVKLPTPIVVKPGTNYEIRLDFSSNVYYTYDALDSSVTLQDGIVVELHNDVMVAVIDELYFNLPK